MDETTELPDECVSNGGSGDVVEASDEVHADSVVAKGKRELSYTKIAAFSSGSPTKKTRLSITTDSCSEAGTNSMPSRDFLEELFSRLFQFGPFKKENNHDAANSVTLTNNKISTLSLEDLKHTYNALKLQKDKIQKKQDSTKSLIPPKTQPEAGDMKRGSYSLSDDNDDDAALEEGEISEGAMPDQALLKQYQTEIALLRDKLKAAEATVFTGQGVEKDQAEKVERLQKDNMMLQDHLDVAQSKYSITERLLPASERTRDEVVSKLEGGLFALKQELAHNQEELASTKRKLEAAEEYIHGSQHRQQRHDEQLANLKHENVKLREDTQKLQQESQRQQQELYADLSNARKTLMEVDAKFQSEQSMRKRLQEQHQRTVASLQQEKEQYHRQVDAWYRKKAEDFKKRALRTLSQERKKYSARASDLFVENQILIGKVSELEFKNQKLKHALKREARSKESRLVFHGHKFIN